MEGCREREELNEQKKGKKEEGRRGGKEEGRKEERRGRKRVKEGGNGRGRLVNFCKKNNHFT